jgi:hypothetical protein
MDNEFVRQTSLNNRHIQTHNRSLWDKFWRDKSGEVVIVQRPNIWLVIWLVLEIVSLFSASHRVELFSWWLGSAALGVWSLLEILQGVNYFRRALGVFIALMTLLTVFGVGL